MIIFFFPGVTVMLSLTVFMNIVSELMPITSDAVPLIGGDSVWEIYLRSIFRDIFQLHHGHGGEQRAADCAGPQLPPQTPGHPQHAHMGQSVLPYKKCLK